MNFLIDAQLPRRVAMWLTAMPSRFPLLLFCLVTCKLIAAGGTGDPSTETKDEKLVRAIKKAIENEVEPGKVDANVGSKATLNTLRKEDAGLFEIVDIAADPGSGPALPDRKTIKYVAYWVRPVDGKNPKIVGIVWPKQGKSQIFYGQVLPPG
jgi:hypothetical protein